MKLKLLLIALIAGHSAFAQSAANADIDTSNYYNYIAGPGSVDWLRQTDAVPVIIDELKKAGYSYAWTVVGDLVWTDDSIPLVVTVSYRERPRFGFVYQPIHGSQDKKVRDRLQRKPQYYSQLDGTKLIKLPENIFMLDEDCYWFHFDDKGGSYPVSKEVAIKILRQDIQAYLQKAKALKK